ncbi:MAG: UPF0280 family protein [Spirochaetales bacterium]|nr:UPF0280 family protein [Spirochaetales bacterium]
MQPRRAYRRFDYRGARYRISSSHHTLITDELKRLRTLLEIYRETDPAFAHSLEPVRVKPYAPEIARLMAAAGEAAGVGPMAAVAGAFAEAAARAALAAGAREAVVENGGDIFIASPEEVVVGIYARGNPLSRRLAFRVAGADTPLAVCSSSGVMGHSLSRGTCDLAVVVARDAALADAAATRAANLVKTKADVDKALKVVEEIKGVSGAFILMEDAVGMTGMLPEIVKHEDPRLLEKIPADESWDGLISY